MHQTGEDHALLALNVPNFLQTLLSWRKAKENTSCLVRRLKLWKDGDLEAHTREGRTIQCHLSKVSRSDNTNEEKLPGISPI